MAHKKTLILMRHAKSSWDDPTLDDKDRPLNKRGKRNAPEMGRRLAEDGFMPEVVISSPARRALKTAERAASELGFEKSDVGIEDSIYSWDSNSVLEAIWGLDDDLSSVMMVIHNPAITDLVNELTGSDIENIPTAGVAVIGFEAPKWSKVQAGSGELVMFDYPKKLR